MFDDKQLMSKRVLLIDTLLPIVENFPNFKVSLFSINLSKTKWGSRGFIGRVDAAQI